MNRSVDEQQTGTGKLNEIEVILMPEARATKKIFKWNPLTTRPRGRHKYRWEDNIIQDLG